MAKLYSHEGEQDIIGACLVNPKLVTELLEVPEEHIYQPGYRLVYRAIRDLFQQDQEIDLFSVSERLERLHPDEGFNWTAELSEVIENTPVTASIKSYRATLADYHRTRCLNQLSVSIQEQINGQVPPEEVLEYLQNEVIGMMSQSQKGGFVDFKSILRAGLDEIERRQEMDGKPDGQVTMYEVLDNTLDGFQNGKVYIVAARTSMGKSAFTLQLLYRLATVDPWEVFSLEMTGKSIGMRSISNASNVYSGKLRGRPLMNQMDYDAMGSAIGSWMNKPIHVDQTPGLSVAQIRARLKAQEMRYGKLGGIVIDHVGLIKKPRGMSATEGANLIANELQELAKEFDCPLIEVIQINRGAEHAADQRPGLSQLKQTGAWEENADVAMLLYRDDYYNPDSSHKGITEVNIAKNRDGETKIIGFKHALATGRYEEIGEMQPEQKQRKYSKGGDL